MALILMLGLIPAVRSPAYAESLGQYFYYSFEDAFFFEIPIVNGQGMSLAEYLESLSKNDTMIFSDYDQNYFVIARGQRANSSAVILQRYCENIVK